ncbi:hypothetical protein L9F63_026722, partial [Diploptera punctata]
DPVHEIEPSKKNHKKSISFFLFQAVNISREGMLYLNRSYRYYDTIKGIRGNLQMNRQLMT